MTPTVIEAQYLLALPERRALSLVGSHPILAAVARLPHGLVGDPVAGLFSDAPDSTDPEMTSSPDADDIGNWAAESSGAHDQQFVIAENVNSPDSVTFADQSQNAPIVQNP